MHAPPVLGDIFARVSLHVSLFLSKPTPPRARPITATLSREELLHEFKGSRVIIPDLYALFPGWKFHVNKHCDEVRRQLNTWMASWVHDEKTRLRMEAADFAMLAGCFYPEAGFEEYLMMAYYHLWVFVWDDGANPSHPAGFHSIHPLLEKVLDCGPLTNNYEKVERYRTETNEYLRHVFGPEPSTGDPPSVDAVIEALSEVAEKVVAGSTSEARARVLRELEAYVDGACALPESRQDETGQRALLSMDGFMTQRARSGGAGPSMTLILYIYHIDLPSLILEHEAVQTIFHQACLIVHLVNDIVSFAKEIRDDQLDNIVPVLAIEQSIHLQDAIERACDLVRKARQTLHAAEQRLPRTGSAELDGQIARYVQGCKDVAAGNLHWSYHNARYFGRNPKREGNKIFLTI